MQHDILVCCVFLGYIYWSILVNYSLFILLYVHPLSYNTDWRMISCAYGIRIMKGFRLGFQSSLTSKQQNNRRKRWFVCLPAFFSLAFNLNLTWISIFWNIYSILWFKFVFRSYARWQQKSFVYKIHVERTMSFFVLKSFQWKHNWERFYRNWGKPERV